MTRCRCDELRTVALVRSCLLFSSVVELHSLAALLLPPRPTNSRGHSLERERCSAAITTAASYYVSSCKCIPSFTVAHCRALRLLAPQPPQSTVRTGTSPLASAFCSEPVVAEEILGDWNRDALRFTHLTGGNLPPTHGFTDYLAAQQLARQLRHQQPWVVPKSSPCSLAWRQTPTGT